MKANRYFTKAQELSRAAVMYNNSVQWAMAMQLLQRSFS